MHQNAAVFRDWFWRREELLFRSQWRVRELSELPPSDRAAVVRAVERGKPVSDPRLALCVLSCANAVMASTQRLRVRRWQTWAFLPIAAVNIVFAVLSTITGTAGDAVFFWLTAVMALGFAGVPWALGRQRARAQAAADLAADQIARSSNNYPPSTTPS